jgi:hypothetical protein
LYNPKFDGLRCNVRQRHTIAFDLVLSSSASRLLRDLLQLLTLLTFDRSSLILSPSFANIVLEDIEHELGIEMAAGFCVIGGELFG